MIPEISNFKSQISTAPAPVTWLSTADAAQRLGLSERHIRRRCGESWHAQGLARQRGDQWEISSAADPLLAAQPSPCVATMDLAQYPRHLVEMALQRKAILDRWDELIAASRTMGLTADQATAGLLATLKKEGLAISPRTLYVWRSAYQDEQLVGLMDGRARRIIEDRTASSDPFLDEIKAFWLQQGEPSVASCYKLALVLARRNNWEICSKKAAERYLSRFAAANPAVVIQLRQGPEAFQNQAARHTRRDYSQLESLEMVDADHHQFDVMVRVGERLNSKTGEAEPIYARPWLSVQQDLRSRKILAHRISVSAPNSDTVVATMRDVCLHHGVPWIAYTDNGKDFDDQTLTGETKHQRRARRRRGLDIDQGRLDGIYAGLGIRHVHAWPFHGQSKPVERWFGTVEDQFGKLFDTYFGSDPKHRPEHYQANLDAGKAPGFEAFCAAFDAYLDLFHNSIHTGDAMDCTPNQAFSANLITKRTAPAELLDLLLQKRIGRVVDGVTRPLPVGQTGVVHKGIWYGEHELAAHYGQGVYISLIHNVVDRVNVFAEDGRFLCVARANLRISPNATPELLSQVISDQKHTNKVMRQAARLKPRLHRDRIDLLNEASRDAVAAAAGDPPPPRPNIRPVRSDLEGQLEAVQQGREEPLKKAVGDGMLPPRPQVQFARAEEDAPAPRFVYHGRSEES